MNMQQMTGTFAASALPVRAVDEPTHHLARRRIISYFAVGLGLTLCYAFLRGTAWQSSAMLHTVMEAVATLLALIVGAMALVRFYSKKSNIFLLIGVGFLGAAFLDGYHAIVTSAAFKPHMPSDLPSLIPWSWVASRQFLSIFLFLSWLAWRREHRLGASGRISERSVYLFAGVSTLLSFVFFAFAPLPRAYYPEIMFHRPEEFLPALFFGLALAGFLRKGDWRHDTFEHWLVLSLIVGVAGQMVFMSFSGALFDMEFDAAHLLKKVSYACVLTGLLANMHAVFRREAGRAKAMAQAKERAEVALAELASQKLAMDEHAIVAVTDTSGTIIYANDKLCQISKFDRDELIGQNHRILKSGHHPESFFAEMYKTIANGKTWHGQIKNYAKDGSNYWVETSITPFKNANGKVVQYVAIRTDITGQKRAEMDIETFNQELRRSNEELQQFATVASHDLKEPLRSLQSFCGLLRSELGDELSENGRDFLSRINRSADRMETLIQDLLNYSRISAKGDAFVPVDLNDVARHIVADLETQISECEASVQIGDLPTIDADPLQMRQLLQNLIGNAIKYRREDARPTVTVEAMPVAGSVDGVPRDWFQMIVRDNGIGFEEEHTERIFGVFQRLHGRTAYEGTGIGLAICRKIVDRHGGRIEAQGVIGEGATFTVTLPKINNATFDGP